MEKAFLDEIKGKDIDLIVVSDGEAILGIGGKAFM
jgi:malic enzyme